MKHLTLILIPATVMAFIIPGGQGQGSSWSPCDVDAEDAVLEFGYYCLGGMLWGFKNSDRVRFPSNFYTLKGWNSTCWSSYKLSSCIDEVQSLKTCSSGHRREIVRESRLYVQKEWTRTSFHPTPGSCDGQVFRDNITQLYSVMSQQCGQLVVDTLDICLEKWLDQRAMDPDMQDSDPEVKSLALSTYQCGVGGSPAKCGPAGAALAKFLLDQTMPPVIRDTLTQNSLRPTKQPPLAFTPLLYSQRSTMGVYGDPHLKIFRRSRLVTCEVAGRKDYLVNRFFRVTGQASHVNQGRSRATALTQLQISFYGIAGEVSTEYKASNGELPDKLRTGFNSGMMAGENEVRVVQVKDKQNVQVRVKTLGLVFHIQRWESYYSLAVRMADHILRQSSGVLVDGCDNDDYIDVTDPSNTRWNKDTTDVECEEACSQVNDSHRFFYNHACLFDCKSTGDTQIATMSLGFQQMVHGIELEDSALPLIPDPQAVTDSTVATLYQPGLTLWALAMVLSNYFLLRKGCLSSL